MSVINTVPPSEVLVEILFLAREPRLVIAAAVHDERMATRVAAQLLVDHNFSADAASNAIANRWPV